MVSIPAVGRRSDQLTRRRSESSTVARPGAAVAAEEQLELQALVPLLANHFKRAHADMPPGLRAVFDAAGLGNRHGAVLARLLYTGPVTVGELARQLGLGLTNASQLIADLDHAGCVERHTDPADRRPTLWGGAAERAARRRGAVHRASHHTAGASNGATDRRAAQRVPRGPSCLG